MDKDTEFKAQQRKVYWQTGLVMAVVLLLVVNTVGLLAGAVFYNEFCVINTRAGLERFNPLQAKLAAGRRNKGWQDVAIVSRFGYVLKGTYLPSPTPSNRTVVFLHGITASRLMGLWYADLYLDEGYNVLLYDARAHGESGGSAATWGFYEKYDLDQWIDWLQERQPYGVIGVQGVSMGAATALEHAGLNQSSRRVSFYVADSAYSDLEELLTQQIGATIPGYSSLWVKALLKYSSAAAYLDSRFYYHEVSPLRAVSHVTTPILYLHGEADALVPVAMCSQLFAATQGRSEMHTFPGVGHAMAIFTQKAEYRRLLHDFLQKTEND